MRLLTALSSLACVSARAGWSARAKSQFVATPSVLDSVSATVTATWSGISNPASNDWVSVYCVGAPESEFGAWNYVTACSGDWSTGACSMDFDLTYDGCDIEFRYYHDPAPYTLVATSNAVSWAPTANTSIRHVRVAYGRTPQREMYVSWTSNDGLTPGVLQLGAASGVYDLPNRTAAPPVTYSPATMCGATGSDPGHFYHVFLDGLAPATRYYARPVQGATVGPEASFVTGKPLGPDVDTKFILYADMYVSGDSGADATAAHTAAMTEEVDFLIHPGDLGYGIGSTSVWNEWMGLIEPTSSRIPYMVTTGNHGEAEAGCIRLRCGVTKVGRACRQRPGGGVGGDKGKRKGWKPGLRIQVPREAEDTKECLWVLHRALPHLHPAHPSQSSITPAKTPATTRRARALASRPRSTHGGTVAATAAASAACPPLRASARRTTGMAFSGTASKPATCT